MLSRQSDKSMTKQGTIYAGIGGWTYEPWRGVFYPKGLVHARELAYAAQHLTSIEVNGTFYRTQTPKTFRAWAGEVPDGFVFALKGPRYAVNRRVLSEAGDSVKRFLESGITELGKKLGPLLWQFAPTKKFDEADFAGFLEHLPKTFDGHRLRHVVEVRNDTFKTPAFIALARKAGVAICYAEHDTYTEIADITADFVYARLQKGNEKLKAGYPPKALDQWAERAKTWATGGAPKDLPRVEKAAAKKEPRDTFIYFIHEAKVRAPAAAMALIERVS
jgi:uncharacterized protein YecE (DUF72 family)